MTTTVNGISVYETKVRGTVTSFIRESAVTPNPDDVVSFDAWETAGTSTNGLQTVSYGGTVVGATLLGKADATYTASVTIDDTAYAISIDLLAASSDFDELITGLNADLPGTEAAISGGNIVITSTGTGKTSYVEITDTDLFAGSVGFIEILVNIPGGTEGELKADTLTNGANGWDAYSSAVEIYDTAARGTVIESNYVVTDLNAVYSDTEVEAEFGLVKTKLDALQSLVDDMKDKTRDK